MPLFQTSSMAQRAICSGRRRLLPNQDGADRHHRYNNGHCGPTHFTEAGGHTRQLLR
jgi:hypothetical protein